MYNVCNNYDFKTYTIHMQQTHGLVPPLMVPSGDFHKITGTLTTFCKICVSAVLESSTDDVNPHSLLTALVSIHVTHLRACRLLQPERLVAVPKAMGYHSVARFFEGALSATLVRTCIHTIITHTCIYMYIILDVCPLVWNSDTLRLLHLHPTKLNISIICIRKRKRIYMYLGPCDLNKNKHRHRTCIYSAVCIVLCCLHRTQEI